MLGRLDHLSWILRTGLSFAAFGAAALVLAFAVIPWRRRRTPAGGDPEREAQRALHDGARFFVGFARRLGLVSLETVDAARLRERVPRVVVANHPTLIDVVVLTSLMPQADCIVSGAWARNPFLRRLVKQAGYVCNDGGPGLVKSCVARLRAGRSVLIFPEGTRSPVGGLGPFRPGAALIALKSGREVLPVRITCEPSSLTKGRSWYDVPDATLRFRVRVDEPFPPRPVEAGTGRAGADGGVPTPRAARLLTAELFERFRKGLEIVDAGRT